MDKEDVAYVYLQWDIVQPWEGRKSCHLPQHRSSLRALYQVKQVRQRKTNTARYHLYVESGKKNQTHRNRKYKSGCHGLGGVGNGERLVR